jgi:hypothetical protein
MKMQLTSNVVRTEGLMTARVDEDMVILDMTSNSYISLDLVGRRIWELLEQSLRIEELCQMLSREFEGSREKITTDVLTFLSELEHDGLVRVLD